jgi:hypothetical protein
MSGMSSNDLKARAYDLIAVIQAAEAQLKEINGEISERGAKVDQKADDQPKLPI